MNFEDEQAEAELGQAQLNLDFGLMEFGFNRIEIS